MSQLLQARHLFSAEEYEMMGEILGEGARVELIEGEIVDMVPIGPRHQSYVNRLTDLFTYLWRGRAVVQVQGPVQLNDLSEVQPDIALLKKSVDEYENTHPGPLDILLVVEVSDTTLMRDLEKAKLYAKSGVNQCWIIDMNNRETIVMTNPTSDGYTTQRRVAANERLEDPIEPGKYFDSSNLFGPAT